MRPLCLHSVSALVECTQWAEQISPCYCKYLTIMWSMLADFTTFVIREANKMVREPQRRLTAELSLWDTGWFTGATPQSSKYDCRHTGEGC